MGRDEALSGANTEGKFLIILGIRERPRSSVIVPIGS